MNSENDNIEKDDLFRETIKFAERIYYHFFEMIYYLLQNSKEIFYS